MKLTAKIANQIWDVLVSTCGATERGRYDFVMYSMFNDLTEYRFIGNLGFGGKFYNNFRVDCYPEDDTPEREQAIIVANKLLKDLKGD